MVKKIINTVKKFFDKRVTIVLILFVFMSCVLIARLFKLQIIDGQSYADNFTVMTTRTRMIQSTRGNIYDRNGELLAYNELSNCVTIEDNGSYETTREKNLSVNGEIYYLTNLIQSMGDTLTHDFHIIVDEDGNYAFDVDEGTTRDRFRADVFGYAQISDLKEDEANASADDIMNYLAGSKRFYLYNEDNPYTEEELKSHGLPAELTKEEILNIVIVRYQLSLISFQRYVPVTVASNVSASTVAAIEENINTLQGVSISQESRRVYNKAESMAPIIGYTGKPSAEELENLRQENPDYNSNSIIGKTGIEQSMETTLQGVDGEETITIDNLGKVLDINEDSRINPVQGNDVYLTIDAELQEACYQILEQRIAGVLLKKIQDEKEGPAEIDDADNDLYIPIYDVYKQLINNNIIDINHFYAEDAGETEQNVYNKFLSRQQEVIDWVTQELSGEGTPYNQLSEDKQSYLDYVYSTYLTSDTGLVNKKLVDKDDAMYQAYFKEETISLSRFLSYASTKNWIDTTKLPESSDYLDSGEIYQQIISMMQQDLYNKSDFSRIIYSYLIDDDVVTPSELCLILYDQNTLSKDDGIYEDFAYGSMTAYELITEKIRTLELTPAQIALDPCSGSAVLNDPDTGEVLALVTYPGYDNNLLSNDMDVSYYNHLYNDQSTPFYNKATQQLTAPGSTYKIVTAVAGLNEDIITTDTQIACNGLFGGGFLDATDQVRCWLSDGHGELNVVGAIENSCNVFFCTVAYNLGMDEENAYQSNQALEKIQEYSALFNLDQKTNIQITESAPEVTEDMPLPSAIGQGTHNYTTSQLSRYAATIYNKGVSYDLTLIQKTTDASGNIIEQSSPVISKTSNFSDSIWNAINEGMSLAVSDSTYLAGLPIEMYAKTGTAQEATNRASHALIIGFSHYESQDDIAFAIRIAHSYSSTNACLVAADIMRYYYSLNDETEILTGTAMQQGISDEAVTD